MDESELQATLERRYVGTCVRAPKTVHAAPLHESDITDAALAAIVEAVTSLLGAGRPVTPPRIESLVASDYPLAARRVAQLLTDGLPYDTDVATTAAVLRERGAFRRVRAVLLPVLASDATPAWDDVQNALQAASSVRADVWGGSPLMDPYDAVVRHLERAAAGLDAPIGVDAQVASTVRLRPGTCLVLGAPTNVGKTSLLAHFLRTAALSGHGAALVSCEDTEEHIAIKWVAEDAEISATALARVQLYGGEQERIMHARERHRERMLRVVHVRDRKLAGVLAGIRQAAAQGCQVVGIDYLTAIAHHAPGQTRRDAVDHVLSEILGCAYGLGLAVILVSQYAREDKERVARRMPKLADLKESGTIENAATYVILLWRWEDKDGAQVEGVVAKVKDGPGVGTRLAWKRDDRGNLRAAKPQEAPKGGATQDFTVDDPETWG